MGDERAALDGLCARFGRVGKGPQPLRCLDRDVPRRFVVGLVEAGEGPTRLERLELRVDVPLGRVAVLNAINALGDLGQRPGELEADLDRSRLQELTDEQ